MGASMPIMAVKGMLGGASSGMKQGVADYKKSIEPAPTTSEVSQASATDAAGIKRRRRGRSPTILTGSTGVQEGATLGTPTLLG
jgi:hypothetical protein